MNRNNLDVQEEVLSWAAYANSVDKIDFLKAFSSTLNSQEISRLKNILGHRLSQASTKRRQWVGPTWDEEKAKRQRLVSPPVESRPFNESRPTGEVKEWWKAYSKADVRAIDVEKVNLRNVKGVARIKPGKIAIVDAFLEPTLECDIFQAPGTFLDGPKDYAVSGIQRFDLKDGEKWVEFEEDEEGNKVEIGARKTVKDQLKGKLIIAVAGQNDLNCMEVEENDCGEVFDLQSFYRRPHPDVSDDTQPMSLRDIYFYHFREDCQFHHPHNATTDAKCTMKIFIEGYIPLKYQSGFVNIRGNVEGIDFSSVPNLKSKQKKGELYCKPSDCFKIKCMCAYCKNKYLVTK